MNRRYQSVLEAIIEHARNHPDKLCLVDDLKEISYQNYVTNIRRLSAIFDRLGVSQSDRVVVEASQRIDFLTIEFALHLIGAVFVPVEHNCGFEKINSFIRKSGAKAVVSVRKESYDAQIALTMEELYALSDETEYEINRLPRQEQISSILFSTGTTGAEKGITIIHENDVALCENVIYGVDMQEDNIEFILSPFNHSHGLRRYYANMYCGATVIMMDSAMNMKRLFDCLECYHVNSMDMVPSALSIILRLSRDKLNEYKNQIRYVQLGGAPMMKDNKEKLKKLLPYSKLFNIYGSTESGISCIYNFNQKDEKENCIGSPAYNADLFIVNDEREEIISSKDKPGLLACRGPINMIGYWDDPQETAKVLCNGVIYTNDIAYVDEDGEIILLGRQGDVINIGGKKVSPFEIEKAAAGLPGIADTACIPVAHKDKGSVPKLFIQMLPGCKFDPVFIRAQLSKLLEPFKIPDAIVQIDRIPRTYKGSLQRNILKNNMTGKANK